MRALVIAIVLFGSSSVIADTAIPGAPVDPAVAQCAAALEKARVALSRDQGFARLAVTQSSYEEDEKTPGCTPVTRRTVTLGDGAGRTASVTLASFVRREEPARPWERNETSLTPGPATVWWSRSLAGRRADINMPRQMNEAGRFLAEARRALDHCLDDTPPPAVPWQGQRAAIAGACHGGAVCIDAEEAVREIETMCQFQSAQVGEDGSPGDTWLAVQRILRLGGGALPYLARLARSANGVARMAAATGLAEVHTDEARRLLDGLAQDDTSVPSLFGCRGGGRKISAVVRERLRRP